jgi:hypothetical protein
MKKVDKIALETPGVAHIISNPGRSFVLNAISSNLGSGFIPSSRSMSDATRR